MNNRPTAQASVNAFLTTQNLQTFNLPARPQTRAISPSDTNWKQQRLTDLTVKAHELSLRGRGLCSDEADELDYLSAELSEESAIPSWEEVHG